MKKIFIVFITVLFYSFSTYAQKFSNEFLTIGVGARSHGLAGAQTSISNDVTSGYWNPAALSGVRSFQLSAMQAWWFANIGQYNYLGVAFPFKNASKPSALSLNMIRFGVDNIPNTINLVGPDGSINYNNVTKFSAADYAMLVSYGRQTNIPNTSVGVTAKILHRSVGRFANAWGFGLDLGLLYTKNNWSLGLNAKDITTTYNAWSFNFNQTEEAIFELTNNDVVSSSTELTYPTIVLGVAKQWRIDKKGTSFNNRKYGILGTVDIDMTTDGQRNTLISIDPISFQPHGGVEIDYNKLIFIRAGIGNFQNDIADIGYKESINFQPNVGLGVQLGKVSIDYALTDIGDNSNVLYSNIISFTIDLSKINRLKPSNRKINAEEAPSLIIEQID